MFSFRMSLPLQKRCFWAALLLGAATVADGATFTVTNAAATGPGTLSQAILDANANGVADVIEFNIPGSGVITISPTSILPDIYPDPIDIDATTQPGYAGTPLIQLRGNLAPAGNGLSLKAGSSTIRGLVVGSFSGFGINIEGPGGNHVEACYIGVDATGTSAIPNAFSGIRISQSAGNTIGGTNAGAGNVISGNTEYGIQLGSSTQSPSPGTTANLICGNRIGTTANGTQRLPNQAGGILVASAPGNLIGGADSLMRNVISGNRTNGVALVGTAATNNTISGNFIGLDVTGSIAISNQAAGILVSGSRNFLGGTNLGAGNVISGNGKNGVDVLGGAVGNLVQGNLIGTTATGFGALPNWGRGVAISAATNNLIGGATANARNIISGNALDGIGLISDFARSNRIEGNFVGTDVTGTNKLQNSFSGIWITNAPGNFIGSAASGGGNVVSGNQAQGITLFGAGAFGNVLQGNFVGLDATGTRGLGNGLEGIWLVNAPSNSIGLPVSGGGNVISGNGKTGIYVQGAAPANTFAGNFVGTDAAGTARIGNSGGDGILIEGAPDNVIGGTSSLARNLISGHNGRGIWVWGTGASNTIIQGNYIGTDVTGMSSIANTNEAIALGNTVGLVFNASIGGIASGAGNLISGNGDTNQWITATHTNAFRPGIYLYKAVGTKIQGNLIGVKADGVSPLGNVAHSVELELATNSVIGGSAPGAGNVIAFSQDGQRSGIRVRSGTRNLISGNSIYSNGRLGISFNGVSPVANDGCDGDGGANGLQNYPVISNAVTDGAYTVVKGFLPSTSGQSYQLEFFASPTANGSGNWEGKLYLGSSTVALASCTNAFVANLPMPVPAGWRITATATDPAGNTSEFSAAVLPGTSPSLLIEPATGDASLISWLLTNSFGGTWQLMQATNLTPPVLWQNVPDAPTVTSNGTWFTVPVSLTNSTRFFRLLYQ